MIRFLQLASYRLRVKRMFAGPGKFGRSVQRFALVETGLMKIRQAVASSAGGVERPLSS